MAKYNNIIILAKYMEFLKCLISGNCLADNIWPNRTGQKQSIEVRIVDGKPAGSSHISSWRRRNEAYLVYEITPAITQF